MPPVQSLVRAIVVSATDPTRQRRLLVAAPAVIGFGERWALPCRAPASRSLPKPGATVWIAFEGGDLNAPVWLGVLG